QADVLFTSYIPLKAHPLYYLGVILFAVGALVGVCLFFATLVIAKTEGTYKGSVPLVTFGLTAAAIIAVVTLAHGAVIYIPTLLWSMGIIQHMDPSTYRLVWWAMGHPSQQINVAAMISVWYLLATLTTGAQPLNEKLCRTAFVLYVLFINVASEHHLLTDPVFSPAHKLFNTGYVMHLAVLASMIHAFAVPASVEVALRKKGYTKGMFEWLKKAPWGDPGFSSMVFSMLLFGFVGGISGVVFGTEQINIIRHNTLSIPGHFHGTVVGGTTMAFMGLTYYVLPLIFRREVVAPGAARIQPYLYAIGVLLLSMGMLIAGTFGVPRRHWDISFTGAPFGYAFDPTVFFALSIMGIGALLAVVGGAIYILVTVGTVLFGKKL
ncbi:MAG: cbb3-type cytochrome c oxidase subunit I, partial [Deltaproteobacteria bacterium]|nr:cbb3-type cytochrome c oxidase subunit I [Deltaproteobacteria bacterium]